MWSYQLQRDLTFTHKVPQLKRLYLRRKVESKTRLALVLRFALPTKWTPYRKHGVRDKSRWNSISEEFYSARLWVLLPFQILFDMSAACWWMLAISEVLKVQAISAGTVSLGVNPVFRCHYLFQVYKAYHLKFNARQYAMIYFRLISGRRWRLGLGTRLEFGVHECTATNVWL